MITRKLTKIIESYSMMTPEASKNIKFVFLKSNDLNSVLVPCQVFTLSDLRIKIPFAYLDKPIWIEKNINRHLSVIYVDFSLIKD